MLIVTWCSIVGGENLSGSIKKAAFDFKPPIYTTAMVKILTTDEIKSEIALQVGEEIFECTPIIYFIDHKGRPAPASSAVALKFEDNYFIVTAAHTLRRFEDHVLGIIPGASFVQLYGVYIHTNSNRIDDDKFDVGIYRLDKEVIERISGEMKFFDLKGFHPDHEDEEGQTYMVVGHPLTRVKLIHAEGRKQLSPFIYLSDLNQQENMFLNQGFARPTHQLFNYRQRRIYEYPSEKMVQGPKPNGLSGCGIWKVSNLIVDDFRSVRYYPTSLVIEYIGDYSVLVATRINVVMEFLRQSFDLNLHRTKLKIKANITS